MFSPAVQPSSSITSGTGSVITMWLEATACARPKPENPAVALFTARTAARARTSPCSVVAVASPSSFVTGVCSWSRTPASMTLARNPRESQAGCTFAAIGKSIPPRKAVEAQRFATSSRVSGTAMPSAPTSAHAVTTSSHSPSCGLARRHLERAAGAVPGIDARRLYTRHRCHGLPAGRRGTPPPPGHRRRGLGGSEDRPTASTQSRRCARSDHGRRASPRARPRRPRAPAAWSRHAVHSPR